MKHRSGAVMLLGIMLLGVIDSALALQCDGKVVSVGYHMWRVRDICGEPMHIEDLQRIVPQVYFDHHRRIYVETYVTVHTSVWTYNFGSNRLIYILTFENDRLVKIETADYGR